MKAPLVSIVTPSYNQGEFLAETIESVLCQEGDFCLDYIVVDGGSSDDSVDIIRKYEQLLVEGSWPVRCRGIRFRWLSEPDRGQADALARGFRMAEGEIFAWLNSDDVYLAGAVQAAREAFARQPQAGLVYGESLYCDENGATIGRYRTGEFDFQRLAWFNFICQPSAFFTREAYGTVGGIDDSLRFALDYDLWIRIGRRFPCSRVPGILSRYRLHDASKTIRKETLFENSEEALHVAIRHFGWAPLNRVYTSCRSRCSIFLPDFLARRGLPLVGTAVICTLGRWLLLNRGIRSRDMKLLTRENFRKLFQSRIEIMTGRDSTVEER